MGRYLDLVGDKADDACVLLVDGRNTVLWQTEGDVADVEYATLFETQIRGTAL